MALYDTTSGVFSVAGRGGGGCCGGLCRLALMLITVLSSAFTIGTLIIAGSALYNVYNEPEQYAVDRTGLVQLWVLVGSSAVALGTNVCGFSGALFRIRCLLLLYALVTSVAVGLHMAVLYLQRSAAAAGRGGPPAQLARRLNITHHAHSVWTVEMNAYASQDVLRRLQHNKAENSTSGVGHINRTMHGVTDVLSPDPESVEQAGLTTVNAIQSLFRCCGKDGVDDFIAENITIPESCCRSALDCNTTLRRHPQLQVAAVRRMVHAQGCGPFLHAAHGFVVTVITWLGYVVAGSQLCGAVIAILLAFCCIK